MTTQKLGLWVFFVADRLAHMGSGLHKGALLNTSRWLEIEAKPHDAVELACACRD